MSERLRISVLKRDGSREPFDFGKLRRSLGCAIRESGGEDHIADALAEAVTMHLQQWRSADPPSASYLHRCCQTALNEAGLNDVAKRMDTYSRARISRRRAICVVQPNSAEAKPWRKRRLVRWFENQAHVSRAMARMLAARIETYLFGLNYELVSNGLIAELAIAELYAWGLSDDLYAADNRRNGGVTSGSGRTPDH